MVGAGGWVGFWGPLPWVSIQVSWLSIMQDEMSPGLVGSSPILVMLPWIGCIPSLGLSLVLLNKGVEQDDLLGLSALTFCTNWQVSCRVFLLLGHSPVVHYCGLDRVYSPQGQAHSLSRSV